MRVGLKAVQAIAPPTSGQPFATRLPASVTLRADSPPIPRRFNAVRRLGMVTVRTGEYLTGEGDQTGRAGEGAFPYIYTHNNR